MQYSRAAIAFFLLIAIFFGYQSAAIAQKPAASRQLEIIADTQEEFYRFENMRVSKESLTPVALYRVNYAVTPAAPVEMAKQYLRENSGLLRVRTDVNDLNHTFTRETPGGYHVRFLQQVENYPVYNGDIVVNLDRQNKVTFVMNNYKHLAKLDNSTPTVSVDEAERIAENYLNVQGRIHYRAKSTVVYYKDRVTRLAHKITIVPAEDLFGDWEILVDAHSGEIFRVENKAVHGAQATTTGSGWVFDPDPLTRGRALYQTGGQFGDNDDADTDSLVAQIVRRDLPEIEYDGMYHLRGPYAEIVDSESPYNGLFSRADSVWHFTRNPSGFEAANVYFHLDQSMRYINETLGFSLMPYQYTGGVRGDPHGLGGDDNSHYSPSTGEIAWGEGGVDDSEDEDVILHELGHAIHDWITNGGLSQVEGLSEGCADYWANSYNRSTGFWTPSDPQYYWVFQWDGHNEYWAGRVTNYTAHYPDGLVGQVHTDGQIWSSTLMQIWEDIGKTATDSDLLEALAMTNSSTNQEDAAQAFIQADLNLYGGANLGTIEYWFTLRGYNVTVPIPTITHTPLSDSEDLDGPYPVSTDVVGTFLLDEVQLIYGTGGAFTDTLDMVYQSGDEYTSAIPGTGTSTDYNYYIFAADTAGLANTHPAGAPGSYHSFSTGTDLTPPNIVHLPLGDQAHVRWPAVVEATITDNFGIDSAWVEYSVNSGAITGSFAMVNTSGDAYGGIFDIDTTVVSIGDMVDYRVVAEDASSQANQVFHPPSGYHTFEIIDVLGIVLIIDDDPSSKHATVQSDKGVYTRNLKQSPLGKSVTDMEDYLLDAGYTVVVETPAATDPGTWDGYHLLISSSGPNTSSLSNATYRTALISYAQSGGKYIIEGGEVGYEWRLDTDVMTDVLHSSAWNGDNAGALILLGSQAGHPMVTAPNALPSNIGVTYTEWGSQDAMTPTDSYVIYETTTDPGDAGISVYDDNSDTTSAQSVYYAFNFAEVSDTLVARDLLENTVNYLLTPEEVNYPPVVAGAVPDTSVAENDGPIDDYRDLNDVFNDVEDGGALAFTIESNSNPALVTVTIDPDSALDLSFAPNENGSATIVIRATDSGLLFVEDTFVVTVIPAEYTLTANVTGSGSVTKTPDQPTYFFGDTVIVQAVPDPCWEFDSWSDGLSGTENPDTIVMASDTTVTAAFTQEVYTLTASVIGSGSVIKTPDQPTYICGDTVIVEAVPDPVWVFDGWSDGLGGAENPDTIAMMSDTTITATFIPDTFVVTVTTTPIDLQVMVDSVTYTAPRQFMSAYGTSHQIGVNNPQDDADTVYVFSDWSDGGTVFHAIVVPDSSPTYTANFTKHFKFALIDSIVDVRDDQGGSVNIHVTRSWYDSAEEETYPIEKYKVWRRADTPAKAPLTDFPPGTWELVDSFPAAQLDHYVHASPTLGDSSDTSLPLTTFVISAHSTTPAEWFLSASDSGYSVDNIFPGTPDSLTAAYNTGSGNHLTWAASGAPDLREFRIYRSTEPDFTPTPVDLVHTTLDTEWYDPEYDGWNVYYKVTAVDDAGNESAPAWDSAPTAVVEHVIPKKLALYQNAPNPFNPVTVIRYDVPAGGARIKLVIYDVSGRLVRSLVDENVSAGRKSVTWDGTDARGNHVSSGIYFYRLKARDKAMTRKMVLLK